MAEIAESKVGKDKPLKYVLLAGIYNQPRSGYEMTKWLQIVGQHCWSVDHSAVYPALRALEGEGLIASERMPGTRGPERSIYSVTAAGRERLAVWVAGPSPRPAIKDEQVLRVLCLDLLPRQAALAQIALVRAEHQVQLEFLQSRQAALTPAQPGLWLVIRRGVLAEAAYIAWCDEVAALVASRPG